MKLCLMRHGPAEEEAESRVDGDRALTASGRDRVRNVAKALLDAGEEPLDVITSPLVRSVQTAEIVAIVTKIGDRRGVVRVRREVAPGGSCVQLVRRLASDGRKRVMLVGHEPDLSALAAALLDGPFGHSFDKATVVGLHLPSDGGRARIRFVLDPATLHLEPAP
jgi:phosphohistidine phosphatase